MERLDDRPRADPSLVERAGDSDGVVVADPREGDARARARSLSLRALTGVGLAAGFAAMMLAPLSEALGNAPEWAAGLPVVIGVAMLCALVALAAYQAIGPTPAPRRSR